MPATVGFQRLPPAMRDALSMASLALADGVRELHDCVLRDEHALAAGAIGARRDAQATQLAAVYAPRRLRVSDEDRAMLTGVAGALSVVMEQLKELAFAIVGATACRDLPTLNVALWLGRRSFGEGAGDSSPTARIAELDPTPLT